MQAAARALARAAVRTAASPVGVGRQAGLRAGDGAKVAYSTASTASEAAAASAGTKPWAFLLVIPPVLTAGLGTWQMQRHGWKAEQLEERDTALQAEPVGLLAGEAIPPPFTRVTCTGVFDHSKAMFLGPRVKTTMGAATKGWVLITPLVPKAGWLGAPKGPPVLVMRGWVPDTWREDPSLRKDGEPKGEVTVVGVTRASEEPGAHTPNNKPAEGEWFWLDAQGMMAASGLPADVPLVESLIHKAPKPAARQPQRPGALNSKAREKLKMYQGEMPTEFPAPRYWGDLRTFSVMPQDHLNYAATWYSISGLTAYMAYLAMRPARVRGRAAAAAAAASAAAVAGGAGSGA